MAPGDLILQAFMSILIGMMVYLWLLSSMIPHGQSVFEISKNIGNATEQIAPHIPDKK
jgi:hypothetical protein